jgi:hypothetical protein
LNDDFLARLQHFADELRAPRAVMMPLVAMPLMLAGAAVTTATIEAAASAAISAAVSAAAIVTTATSTAIPATAERPLETRAGIAANAG